MFYEEKGDQCDDFDTAAPNHDRGIGRHTPEQNEDT